MGMNTIKFIQRNGWEALTSIGIKVTWHPTLPIAVLNYEQWADKFHPVVLECRGLVLDTELNVLCLPLYRFFNYGEVDCTRDFSDAIAYEKLDGTMINVWWYNDQWFISTRNSFGDAQTAWGNTFRGLVYPLLEESLPDMSNEYNHVFEFISPENRVLTPYKEHALYYLVSIKNNSGVESFTHFVDITTPKEYFFNSIEELNNSMANLPELEEGYVVHWPDNFRLKVKNPAYLALSKTNGVHYRNSGNGAMSQKRAMEIYFAGDADEYLTYFPEDAPLFDFRTKWETLVKYYKELILSDKELLEKKSRTMFAEYIRMAYPKDIHHILFAWDNGIKPEVYLNELPVSKKIRLLET
jgi:hypothetical protein